MSDVIGDLARIKVPEALKNSVDFSKIVEDFQENFGRLGDFEAARKKHAGRDWTGKMWDAVTFDSSLEMAQLDATEVQASFSKSIGQLVVLTVLQSQHLLSQQQQLESQQNLLLSAQNNIGEQQGALAHQNRVLAEKSEEIRAAVQQLVELKEYTHAGLEKTIRYLIEEKESAKQLLQEVSILKNEISLERTRGQAVSKKILLGLSVVACIAIAAMLLASRVLLS